MIKKPLPSKAKNYSDVETIRRHKIFSKLHEILFAPTTVATSNMLGADEEAELSGTLTPNMRGLRLALTIGEVSLSMGVPASEVVSKILTVAHKFCRRQVQADVTSTSLMVSQYRGINHEPLTLIRLVAPQSVNVRLLRRIDDLVSDIEEQPMMPLETAEERLLKILNKPHTYPRMTRMLANAAVAAGVAMTLTTSWIVIGLTYLVGILITWLLEIFARWRLPSFFTQIGVAIFIVLSAMIFTYLGRNGVDIFSEVSSRYIVAGGIVMLVAGLTIVSSMQDAIDEFYVTAGARFLKVFMMTGGIVIGIIIGAYIAQKVGYQIQSSTDAIPLNSPLWQLGGAIVISTAWALFMQSNFKTVLCAAAVGGGAFLIQLAAMHYGLTLVASSGIAAIFIGATSVFLSRKVAAPSFAIISAAIVPLVPGMMLYNSLMQIVLNPISSPEGFEGITMLLTAIGIAVAIAAGASIGSIFARPVQQKLQLAQNYMPSATFNSIRRFAGTGRSNTAFINNSIQEENKNTPPF